MESFQGPSSSCGTNPQGLLGESTEGVTLTAAGIDQAEMLWNIAETQQEKIFSHFSEQQIETFKEVLKGIVQAC
ncbi:hypothetical protein D9M68_514780 [compost metagenome]